MYQYFDRVPTVTFIIKSSQWKGQWICNNPSCIAYKRDNTPTLQMLSLWLSEISPLNFNLALYICVTIYFKSKCFASIGLLWHDDLDLLFYYGSKGRVAAIVWTDAIKMQHELFHARPTFTATSSWRHLPALTVLCGRCLS